LFLSFILVGHLEDFFECVLVHSSVESERVVKEELGGQLRGIRPLLLLLVPLVIGTDIINGEY
jgi:hypothetical protein